MTSSAETLPVARPPRQYRFGKVVALTLLTLAALPVTLFVGAWVAGEISEGTPATPSKVTVPTTVR